jgi:hypothetical protein
MASMNRALLRSASALLPAWLAACAPPAAAIAPSPASSSAAAPSPAASLGAQLFLPPPERCAPTVVEPRVAPAFDDVAPLSVTAGPAGVALESGGATAGRVLIALAKTTRRPLRVRGYGASVRIYAHVDGVPAEVLRASVLAAAGLVMDLENGSEPEALDPAEAERRRSARLASVDVGPGPLETRLVPARHPLEIAPVLARLVLSCPRGEIVAVPGRSLLVIRDQAGPLNRMDALVAAVEAEPFRPFQMEASSMRGSPFATPAPDHRGCESIAARAAPDLQPHELSANGVAAGALLRELARRRGKNVVVGCGGDRPAFLHTEGELEPGRVAELLGLREIDAITFGSEQMVKSNRAHADASRSPSRPYLVHGYVVPDAAGLALAAERMVAPGGSAVAYLPASMVLVGGVEPYVGMAEVLVKGWPHG